MRYRDTIARIMGSGNGSESYGIMSGGFSESGEAAFQGQGGQRPRVLAHAGDSWKHMVHDATHLYWTDAADGTVTKLAKGGGVPLVIAADQRQPAGLAIEDGVLYWVNQRGGTVVRMAASGGEIATLASNQNQPTCIAVAGNDVVWGNLCDITSGTLMKGSTTGGEVATLALDQKYPHAVAIDEAHIYWTTLGTKHPDYFANGAVMRMPRGTPGEGEEETGLAVASPQWQPEEMALDNEWIYWTTNGSIHENWGDGTVMKRRKSGGEPIPLVQRTRSAGSLALDATHVYWAETLQSAIHRVPKHGGDPVQLVSSKESLVFPRSLVVDDTCVYWTVYDSKKAGGAIWRIGK